MKIKKTYFLTEEEVNFLKALSNKTHPENRWSGRSSDDSFREKWKNEIDSFSKSGLTTKIDDGYGDSYWCYGLNNEGEKIQYFASIGQTEIAIEKEDSPNTVTCQHRTQNRITTHQGTHCGDCGKRFK